VQSDVILSRAKLGPCVDINPSPLRNDHLQTQRFRLRPTIPSKLQRRRSPRRPRRPQNNLQIARMSKPGSKFLLKWRQTMNLGKEASWHVRTSRAWVYIDGAFRMQTILATTSNVSRTISTMTYTPSSAQRSRRSTFSESPEEKKAYEESADKLLIDILQKSGCVVTTLHKFRDKTLKDSKSFKLLLFDEGCQVSELEILLAWISNS